MGGVVASVTVGGDGGVVPGVLVGGDGGYWGVGGVLGVLRLHSVTVWRMGVAGVSCIGGHHMRRCSCTAVFGTGGWKTGG